MFGTDSDRLADRLAQRAEECRARRRGQLRFDLGHPHGSSLEHPDGRRRGDGQNAVSRLHEAAPLRDHGSVAALHVQDLERPRGADDVHDGVQRPDLVEMDLLEGGAVHLGLAAAQELEGGERAP